MVQFRGPSSTVVRLVNTGPAIVARGSATKIMRVACDSVNCSVRLLSASVETADPDIRRRICDASAYFCIVAVSVVVEKSGLSAVDQTERNPPLTLTIASDHRGAALEET